MRNTSVIEGAGKPLRRTGCQQGWQCSNPGVCLSLSLRDSLLTLEPHLVSICENPPASLYQFRKALTKKGGGL